jgi:hypothetical protein
MTDPFALSQPGTVVQTAETLNTIIANCWPRVSCDHYQEEVYRIVATCWINSGDKSSSLDHARIALLQGELKKSAAMLQVLRESCADKSPMKAALQDTPELQGLFAS